MDPTVQQRGAGHAVHWSGDRLQGLPGIRARVIHLVTVEDAARISVVAFAAKDVETPARGDAIYARARSGQRCAARPGAGGRIVDFERVGHLTAETTAETTARDEQPPAQRGSRQVI